ncbi:MAG: hypothetical protein MSG64_18515 [Pyrinomonadaceae bacterium MAG19_C2-C3]|nr:hypothetical protein [Pyrinomonadaceae bacterium MAG19_C2-C3]
MYRAPCDAGEVSETMITIEKAVADDFERVYPLLLSFGSTRNSKDDWRRLFVNHWDNPEDFCGYMLLKDGEVKGFLSLIFSVRVLNDRIEKLCNMNSWVVSEDCRGQSLAMLLKVLKLKDYTITNFTPSKSVQTISSKMGFTHIETQQQLLLPVPRLSVGARTKWRCVFGKSAIREKLNDVELKILEDHEGLGCENLLISADNDYCYLVVKRMKRRHLPIAKIHYISRPDLFIEAIDALRNSLCLGLRVMALVVDDRFLRGQTLQYARKYPQYCMTITNSESLDTHDIDTLYSELILLH